MKKFEENNASEKELWDYCMCEYNSRNLISVKLFDNFYNKLKDILLSFNPDDRVLEIGCGAGESSRRIREVLKKNYFEASDYDERYVNVLSSMNLDFKISHESVYSLKRKDNEYDRVIMLEVLEHLTDYELALKELFRVASRSVVISVPNEPLWRILNMLRLKYLKNFGNTPGHINHFTKGRLVNMLNKYGIVKNIYTPVPWIIIECEKH